MKFLFNTSVSEFNRFGQPPRPERCGFAHRALGLADNLLAWQHPPARQPNEMTFRFRTMPYYLFMSGIYKHTYITFLCMTAACTTTDEKILPAEYSSFCSFQSGTRTRRTRMLQPLLLSAWCKKLRPSEDGRHVMLLPSKIADERIVRAVKLLPFVVVFLTVYTRTRMKHGKRNTRKLIQQYTFIGENRELMFGTVGVL